MHARGHLSKSVLLAVAACLFCVLRVAGQDLNGFAIGMSKLEACRYIEQHPAISLQTPTKCREMDDRVVVNVSPLEFAEVQTVNLAFDETETIGAIWSNFPAVNFSTVYSASVNRFGKPTWEKEYRAGHDDAALPNRFVYWHTKKAEIYLEQQNKLENGQATGWLALDPPNSFPLIPPASFIAWDTRKTNTPGTSWGDRATPGSER